MAVSVIEQSGTLFNTQDQKVLSVALSVVNSSSNNLNIRYPLTSESLSPLALSGYQGFSYIDYNVNIPSPFSTRYWYEGEYLLQDLGIFMTSPPFPSSVQGVEGVDYNIYNGYISILPGKKLTFIISFYPNPMHHDLNATYSTVINFENHSITDDSISVHLNGNYGTGTLNVSKIDGASFALISHVVGVPKSGLNKIS